MINDSAISYNVIERAVQSPGNFFIISIELGQNKTAELDNF